MDFIPRKTIEVGWIRCWPFSPPVVREVFLIAVFSVPARLSVGKRAPLSPTPVLAFPGDGRDETGMKAR